jgi:hypothetical protein
VAVPPLEAIGAANSLRFSFLRAPKTTFEPFSTRSAAVARPIPLLAPVTTITYLSSLKLLFILNI